MQLFFPKEKLKNSPKGFNLIPIRRQPNDDPNAPAQFRAELDITPFHDYEKDVIRVSHPEAIDPGYAVEMLTFVLMRHDKNWLVVKNADGAVNAGLLPELVNRGDEQRVISNMLNTVNIGEAPGEKGIAVLGYIIEDDRVIFMLRFDFNEMPSFNTRKKTFEMVPVEDFFNPDYIKDTNFDELSRAILIEAEDIWGDKA
jgi:hypothetical protein